MDVSWDDLRFLLAVEQRQSFLAAGKALGVSTSTVARRVEALELALGRKLVERSSDGARLSRDTAPLLAIAQDLQSRLEALKRDDVRSPLAGVVRLSIDGGSSTPTTRILCEYRRRAPDTVIEVVAEMRLADLARREADLGIRGVRSTSKVLIDRPLGRVSFGLYCARAYADLRLPSLRLRANEFHSHDFVGKLSAFPQQVWLEQQGATRFSVRSDSITIQKDAALQGAGIALLPKVFAREWRDLLELETESMFPAMASYLVYHQDIRKVPHIIALAKFLEARARAGLAL